MEEDERLEEESEEESEDSDGEVVSILLISIVKKFCFEIVLEMGELVYFLILI